jgi:hypothetical protein
MLQASLDSRLGEEGREEARMWSAMEGDAFYDESGMDATLCSCCERDRADQRTKTRVLSKLRDHDPTRIAIERRNVAMGMFRVDGAEGQPCTALRCNGCDNVIERKQALDGSDQPGQESNSDLSDWEEELDNDPEMQGQSRIGSGPNY